jgi:glycosyltransferase involved in cell wall biosynthesis
LKAAELTERDTIIVPVFNRADIVSETLDSLLAQTYPNWECIVVDDHSTDSTWQTLVQYQEIDNRINVHRRPDDRLSGGNACRNYGAELSTGDFLIFLDSDDLLLDTCIEQRVHAALHHPGYDMWVFSCQVFSHQPGDRKELWNVLHKEHTTDLKRFLDQDMPWNTSSPLWKKDFFWALGGFGEHINVWQDWELHIRAICENGNIYKSGHCHIDCFYRKGDYHTISGRYRTIEYKKEVQKFIYDTYMHHDQIKHYRRNYVNLIMRSLYTFYLRGNYKDEVRNVRINMMRIKLIGRVDYALLASLDAIFLLGSGKIPKLTGLLSRVAKIVTDDYLVFRTTSTHLNIKHPLAHQNSVFSREV